MGRQLTLALAEIRAYLPRGTEAMWDAIRTLDPDGPWAVSDIVDACHCDRREAVRYVSGLLKAGYAQTVGERPAGNFTAPLHSLLRKPLIAPRFDRDGAQCKPSGQEQMWTAIRNLPTGFTFHEIAHAASTDEVVVPAMSAKAYLKRLLQAGYLNVLRKGAPARAALLSLKPSMNTGPLPPLILRTKFVWDQNRKAVMGTATEAEEVRP